MVKIPNRFIVGPPKCMTTSIVASLVRSTNAIAPIKEPFYFSSELAFDCGGKKDGPSMCGNWRKGENWYKQIYRTAPSHAAPIDASTLYFSSDDAVVRISKTVPDPKILIVLRDPLERLISHYYHELMLGYDLNRGLDKLSELGEQRIHHYMHINEYSLHIKKFLNEFGSSRVHVVIMEDLVKKPVEGLEKIADFFELKVHSSDLLYLESANHRKKVKYSFLQRARRKVYRSGALAKLPRWMEPCKRVAGRVFQAVVFGPPQSHQQEDLIRRRLSDRCEVIVKETQILLGRDDLPWRNGECQ